jgi:hypothetical protein
MRMPGFDAEIVLPQGTVMQKQVTLELGPARVCKCAPACKRVTMCLFQYCTEVTICDDCAYVYDCVGGEISAQ